MQRRDFLSALRDGIVLLSAARISGAPDDRQHIKLFLGGDVMTGRGIDQVLRHPSDPVLYERYVRDARDYVRIAERENGPITRPVDEDYIWGDALGTWESHQPDVRIVNLETSVTASDDYWPSKGIHYRMHPRNVACLNAADLDCCTLANNHVLDWGYSGLEETLVTLHVAGLKTAGAGRSSEEASRPARLPVPGKGDVLVFAVAHESSGVPRSWRADGPDAGVNLLPDLSRRSAERLGSQIGAARHPEDVVVLSIHWGGNWGYGIPVQQREFAHRLIDSGAVDVVHGHSSHHAKAIEYYRGKIILYGCGDFVNDYEGIGGRKEFRPWLAPMYFVTFNLHSRQVDGVELEIMRMKRFQLMQANAGDRRWLVAKLSEISEKLGTCFDVANSMRGSACQIRRHRSGT